MKNMTSPARNSNRRISGLCSVLCVLSVLTVFLTACDKKNDPTPTPTEQDLNDNVARPTWTVPEDYDYSSSMTAVIAVHQLCGVALSDSAVGSNDLLAAFIGEECHGIAAYDDGLFYLYIAGPTANANANAVTLRYYSAHYKNLFEARDAFHFVNDANLGTVAEPLIPAFVVVK